MPKNPVPFVQLKNMFKDAAAVAGEKISDRDAHRMAQGFMLSHAAEEECQLQYSDETGEEAVKAALLSYIRRFGTLHYPAPVTALSDYLPGPVKLTGARSATTPGGAA